MEDPGSITAWLEYGIAGAGWPLSIWLYRQKEELRDKMFDMQLEYLEKYRDMMENDSKLKEMLVARFRQMTTLIKEVVEASKSA